MVNALTTKTVGGLLDLANRALAGEALPAGVTLSMIAEAVDLINNAFDGCRLFIGYFATPKSCSQPNGTMQTKTEDVLTIAPKNSTDEITVNASPNPFSDQVRFEIKSAISGEGTIDIYNTLGARIANVYQGYISAGTTYHKYSVPPNQRVNLIYVLRIGKTQISGKLLNLSKSTF